MQPQAHHYKAENSYLLLGAAARRRVWAEEPFHKCINAFSSMKCTCSQMAYPPHDALNCDQRSNPQRRNPSVDG